MIPTWLLDRKTWIAVAVLSVLAYAAWWLKDYADTQYQAGYDARIAEESEARAESDQLDNLILESVLQQRTQELEAARALVAELQQREPETVTVYVNKYLENPDRPVDLGDGFAGVWNNIFDVEQSGSPDSDASPRE